MSKVSNNKCTELSKQQQNTQTCFETEICLRFIPNWDVGRENISSLINLLFETYAQNSGYLQRVFVISFPFSFLFFYIQS